MLVLVEQG